MGGRFENELDWMALVGALAIWSAHFMVAWAISSVFPGERIVLWLTLALTGAALAALAWLWRRRKVVTAGSVAGLAIVLAALAVLYDFLPALMA